MENTFDATKVQAWVHNLDPFLIQFSDTFGIRWYGLAYMFGFIAGAAIMIWLSKRGRRTLPAEQVTDFITYIVLGTMIGGRLGYVLFYDPSALTEFTSVMLFGMRVPVWSPLAVWEGGMASHGGIMGIIIAEGLYAKRHKQSWLHLGDLGVLGGAIGIVCGRLANFVNGELMGRPVHSDLPWAVKFPADLHRWLDKERVRLPSLSDVVSAPPLNIAPDQWSQWVSQYSTNSEAHHRVADAISNILFQIQAGNETVRQRLAPLLEARHPSQLYQAFLEGFVVLVICFLAWRKPRKPGVIGGIFLVSYAIMRIIGEQFRMPDAHIGYQLLGLTRGQWLSLGMLAGSVIFFWVVARRQVDRISGWGPEAMELKLADEAAAAPASNDTPGKRGRSKKS